ncbi:hypothetical protein ACFPM7_03995 [Actinokineospora guangxiensis]|uniref:Uncharacterized protein n=1 Tax=Actinokineospora guangxiensis TaxID=1490288 RepID=A0ABW0EJ85_9PSEU
MIASGTPSKVAEYERAAAGYADLEVRFGSVPETGADCDAVVITVPIAHDWHGGFPVIGRAQVLLNERNDDSPPFVVTTIPFEIGNFPDVSDWSGEYEYMRSVLEAGMRELVSVLGEASLRVLVHSDGAGFSGMSASALVEAVVHVSAIDYRVLES